MRTSTQNSTNPEPGNHQAPPALMRFKGGFLVLAGIGFALLVSFLAHRFDVAGALEFPRGDRRQPKRWVRTGIH